MMLKLRTFLGKGFFTLFHWLSVNRNSQFKHGDGVVVVPLLVDVLVADVVVLVAVVVVVSTVVEAVAFEVGDALTAPLLRF